MNIVAVLPAYNEEAALGPLLRAWGRLAVKLPANARLRVIVVDDGSKDRTAAVARRAARAGLPVELVQHPQNRGLGDAIKTGLRAALEIATAPDDFIVCMDGDNTHPPATVLTMLDAIDERRGHIDIVIASRFRPGSRQVGVPPHRVAFSLGAAAVFWTVLALPGVRDYTCGFRAYRAGMVRDAFAEYGDDLISKGSFACTDQLLLNMAAIGARITEVPFVLRYDRKPTPSKMPVGATIIETFRLLFEARRRLKRRRR